MKRPSLCATGNFLAEKYNDIWVTNHEFTPLYKHAFSCEVCEKLRKSVWDALINRMLEHKHNQYKENKQ